MAWNLSFDPAARKELEKLDRQVNRLNRPGVFHYPLCGAPPATPPEQASL